MRTRRHCNHTDGRHHTCSQVDRINKHIPYAEKYADREIDIVLEKENITVDDANALWSRVFHAEMNRRCAADGTRRLVVH